VVAVCRALDPPRYLASGFAAPNLSPKISLHFHATGELRSFLLNLLKIERIAAVVRKTDKTGSKNRYAGTSVPQVEARNVINENRDEAV
jgi:hypothetical protein